MCNQHMENETSKSAVGFSELQTTGVKKYQMSKKTLNTKCRTYVQAPDRNISIIKDDNNYIQLNPLAVLSH